MLDFLSNFDSKKLEKTGLIFIILVLLYFMWDLSGDKINNVAAAVTSFQTEDTNYQSHLNDTLNTLSTVIAGNTEVMREVLNLHK